MFDPLFYLNACRFEEVSLGRRVGKEIDEHTEHNAAPSITGNELNQQTQQRQLQNTTQASIIVGKEIDEHTEHNTAQHQAERTTWTSRHNRRVLQHSANTKQSGQRPGQADTTDAVAQHNQIDQRRKQKTLPNQKRNQNQNRASSKAHCQHNNNSSSNNNNTNNDNRAAAASLVTFMLLILLKESR